MSKTNSSYKIIIKGNKTPYKNKDEQSTGNTTNHDSLHDTKKLTLKNYKIESNNNEKKNNFFMALQSLKSTSENTSEINIFDGINEYSETNPNQTKEENISKYIHRPLIKQIIKDGNNLNIIRTLTQFGTSINNPYVFNYNIGYIIDNFKENKTDNNRNQQKHDKIIHYNATINATSINKNKYKKIFKVQNNNKINTKNNKKKDEFINFTKREESKEKNKKSYKFLSTNIKPFNFNKIIDDLEKPVDIKVKDYENTINNIKKNQKLDNNKLNEDKTNEYQLDKDKLRSLVKTLNFQDMSKNEKTDKKINKNNDKDNKYSSKIKNMLISKINNSTAEKIRKKYERSELKKNRILQISATIKNKNTINLIENENKENFNYNNNNIELTKKIIKRINEMTTIKADYNNYNNNNNNELIDINNNLLINFYKKKDNINCSTQSKKIAKNLLNIFNSCSKKINFDGSSLNIDNQSLKNINNSSFQEIMDLFSDRSIMTIDKNENNNTILIKDTQKKLTILSEFNSLFESNIINSNSNINNSLKKEMIINSNIISPNYLNKNICSDGLYNIKNNSEKENKNNVYETEKKVNKNKNVLICYSPLNQKVRKFDLDSPFNSSMFSNEYTFYNFPPIFATDIKLKNIKRSQEILNKVIKNNFQGGILQLSESPSLINTQSQKSFKIFSKTDRNKNISKSNNITDSKNNNIIYKSRLDSKDDSYSIVKLNESQLPNTIYDISFYLNLINQSNSYPNIDTDKLFNKNPTIKWEDRLKILLWMMKNCEEFAYKRDTFHYSVFYFDLFLFLSKEEIKKKDLKLIGITCISLSAKIEEVQIPKLIEYSKSIDPNCDDINIIVSMEQKICSALKWKLIPITIEIWLNWYTCQWDLYMDSSPDITNQLLEYIKEEDIIYFKKQDDKAYCNYRRIYQLIDLISLDFNNYKYDKRGICAACFLDSICFQYHLEYSYELKKIYSKQKKNQNFINVVQKMFDLFVEQSFDFLVTDQLIQKCIQYVFKFRKFPFSYNMPLIYKARQKIDEDIEYNYEDFISYQTTNSDIFPFFEKMYKTKDKNNKIIMKKMYNIRI